MVAGGVRGCWLVRGGWLVRRGWLLAVGGVGGRGARWLPSRPLVLFVHGVLWLGGVGRWAVVVVGVVLVVVVVGPLVVVVWVVVGLVLGLWPMDSLWVFRSPLWGWGVGHRGQSPGLHYVVGTGEGLGAGLDGDGGRRVPRPWVGLAGGGGGLWGMDDGAPGDGDADEGLDGVVLGGRLCGGGGCRREGGAGCGGWGVLAWARARAGVVSGGFVSLRMRCCVCSRGRRLGFGVGFGVGPNLQPEDMPSILPAVAAAEAAAHKPARITAQPASTTSSSSSASSTSSTSSSDPPLPAKLILKATAKAKAAAARTDPPTPTRRAAGGARSLPGGPAG